MCGEGRLHSYHRGRNSRFIGRADAITVEWWLRGRRAIGHGDNATLSVGDDSFSRDSTQVVGDNRDCVRHRGSSQGYGDAAREVSRAGIISCQDDGVFGASMSRP